MTYTVVFDRGKRERHSSLASARAAVNNYTGNARIISPKKKKHRATRRSSGLSFW